MLYQVAERIAEEKILLRYPDPSTPEAKKALEIETDKIYRQYITPPDKR